jgi:hypothetical protein
MFSSASSGRRASLEIKREVLFEDVAPVNRE